MGKISAVASLEKRKASQGKEAQPKTKKQNGLQDGSKLPSKGDVFKFEDHNSIDYGAIKISAFNAEGYEDDIKVANISGTISDWLKQDDKDLKVATQRYRDAVAKAKDTPGIFLDEIHAKRKSLHEWKKNKGYISKDSKLKRLTEVKDALGEVKRKLLPHIYFSAIFDGAGVARENVVGLTGIVSLDIEGVTSETLELIKQDSHTMALAPSASGPPNYFLLAYVLNLDLSNYGDQWEAVNEYYKTRYNIPKSDNVRDVTRIRYAVFFEDGELYFNKDATPFVAPVNITFGDITEEHQKKIGAFLTPEPNWVKFVWSACAAFGRNSDQTFEIVDKFSRYAPGHDNAEADSRIREVMGRFNERIGTGTFIWLLNGWGVPFEMKARKKNDIVIHGIGVNTFTFALCDLKTGLPFTNVELHRKWAKDCPPDANSKRVWNFDYWRHEVTAIAEDVNPIEIQFEKEKWNGTDYFKILAKYVKTNRNDFAEMIKKHMIRGLYQILNDKQVINKFALVLHSNEKGHGKTTLLTRLTLSHLTMFSAVPDLTMSISDIKTVMCSSVNVLLEELESLTLQQKRSVLKALISMPSHAPREHYTHSAISLKRMASLWGSLNDNNFLHEFDPTRWIVFTITEKIDHVGYEAEVDFKQMWLQAHALYKDGHDGQLTEEEIKYNAEILKDYVIYTPLEQEVDEMYEEVPVAQREKPISVSEVAKGIASEGDYNDRSHLTHLGYAIQKLFPTAKYPKRKFDGKAGSWYWVRKKSSTSEDTPADLPIEAPKKPYSIPTKKRK